MVALYLTPGGQISNDQSCDAFNNDIPHEGPPGWETSRISLSSGGALDKEPEERIRAAGRRFPGRLSLTPQPLTEGAKTP